MKRGNFRLSYLTGLLEGYVGAIMVQLLIMRTSTKNGAWVEYALGGVLTLAACFILLHPAFE
jgi:hypothetical protein